MPALATCLFPRAVLACWNYCSLDARALARFTFNLYDISNKRVLTSVSAPQHNAASQLELDGALLLCGVASPIVVTRAPVQDEIRQMVAEVYGDQYESQTHLRKIIKDAVDVKGSFASTPGQLTLSTSPWWCRGHRSLCVRTRRSLMTTKTSHASCAVLFAQASLRASQRSTPCSCSQPSRCSSRCGPRC